MDSSTASLDEILAWSDVPFLKAVVARYPETARLAGPAEASPEGNPRLKPGSLAVRVFEGIPVDETAIEAERTFVGVLLFRAVLNGDASAFPFLAPAAFANLRDFTSQQAPTPEDVEFVLYALACNDLGKTQAMIDHHADLTGRRASDHDLLLAELVDRQPGLFPGLRRLTAEQQLLYRDGLRAHFNLGQMVQGESLPASLTGIQEIGERARGLRLIAELYDFAGAAGHVRNDLSLLMTEDTLFSYQAAMEELMRVPRERAYERFIARRGEAVGIRPEEPDAFVLGRIAALSRSFTGEEGGFIRAVWRSLVPDERDTLARELNEPGRPERPGILLYYAPAVIANAIKATGQFETGLRWALGRFAEQYRTTRQTLDPLEREAVVTLDLRWLAHRAARGEIDA